MEDWPQPATGSWWQLPREMGPRWAGVLEPALAGWLLFLARLVLRRHRPVVVAVTGSVGKTTTKEQIAGVLRVRHTVLASPGNRNSRMGVAASVLGLSVVRVPGTQAVHGTWNALRLLAGRRPFPAVVVLEMGAGRPGDLEQVTRAIRPDVAVLTNIRDAHIANYPSASALAGEKTWPLRRLRPGGLAVLNAADPVVRSLAPGVEGDVVLFGDPDGAVRATDVVADDSGMSATLVIDGAERIALRTPLMADHQLGSLLAAVAVGRHFGVAPREATAALADVGTLAGHGRIVTGRDDRRVICEFASASPQAMLDAIALLRRLPAPRVAVLGPLIELGSRHDEVHRGIAAALAPWVDRLVVVGDGADLLAGFAGEVGVPPDHVVVAPTPSEASATVLAGPPGGTVLLKGPRRAGLSHVAVALIGDREALVG